MKKYIAVLHLLLLGCATHVPTMTIEIPEYAAAAESSALSSIPAMAIHVIPFKDHRAYLEEGTTTGSLGIPMRNVRFVQSPAGLLNKVIISELKVAGHRLSDSVDGPQITGAVEQFKVSTNATPLYWDVIGNIAVSLQVSPTRNASPDLTFVYTAECKDRTYLWPGETVIGGVMSKCLNDFGNQFRSDRRVTEVLRQVSPGR